MTRLLELFLKCLEVLYLDPKYRITDLKNSRWSGLFPDGCWGREVILISGLWVAGVAACRAVTRVPWARGGCSFLGVDRASRSVGQGRARTRLSASANSVAQGQVWGIRTMRCREWLISRAAACSSR